MVSLLKNAGKLTLMILLLSNFWMGCEPKKSTEEAPQEIITEAAPPEALTVDSKALELLQRGLDYLSNLDQFSVKTQSTYEDVLNGKYRVDYETTSSLMVDRPDKMRVERYGLNMNHILTYDGSSITQHNPDDNVYDTEPVPANIEEMFHYIRDTFAISGPSTDLIYKNSYALLSEDVNAASVIGKELIGDIMCDHLLFNRNDGVSFQIWISVNEPYLPYKYVVTDTSTPQLLSYSTILGSWNTAPKVSEASFKFTPGKDSKKTTLLRTDQNVQ